MKPKLNSFLPALSLAIPAILAITGLSQSTFADTTWTGTNSQMWTDPGNWSNGLPSTGNGQINIGTATGNYPILATDASAGWDIVVGGNAGNGRLDQTAGTLATGNGNWFFLGYTGHQATYNLTGSGSLKVGGSTTPNGNFLIGLDGGTVSTWKVNTTGTAQAGNIYAGGAGASTGIINMDAGTVSVSGEIQIGASFFGNGGSGQLNMTGGTVTANILSFARADNSAAAITGTATISGGTLNSQQYFTLGFAGNSSNVATVTNSGGTVNVNTSGGGNMELGVWDSTQNTFNVNSGLVTLQNNASIKFGILGHSGQSTVNQNGGTVTFYSDAGSTVGGTGGVVLGSQGANPWEISSGTYKYNLNGGTLTAPSISKASASASGTFNFNGGTLKATGSTITFMQGLTAANVQNGGAVIDSNGYNVTVSQALLDGGTGGLTKQGGGALTLAGANTYDGATTVSAGTLFVSGSLGNTAVTVENGATIGGVGSILGSLNFDAGSKLDVSGGILSVAGLVSFDGFGFDDLVGFNVNSAAIGSYTLISGSNFDFTNVENFGLANAISLDGGKSAYFESGSLQVVVIPEPTAALLGGIGMLALLRRRR